MDVFAPACCEHAWTLQLKCFTVTRIFIDLLLGIQSFQCFPAVTLSHASAVLTESLFSRNSTISSVFHLSIRNVSLLPFSSAKMSRGDEPNRYLTSKLSMSSALSFTKCSTVGNSLQVANYLDTARVNFHLMPTSSMSSKQ